MLCEIDTLKAENKLSCLYRLCLIILSKYFYFFFSCFVRITTHCSYIIYNLPRVGYINKCTK
uniref:Uncharacterized protein n=1 Tax=Anguilla anguilla TaxID=7936 RepID=A0A0E9WA08_ANGAN